MRIGLMSYNLSGLGERSLHNSPYFVSYDPKSYCPNPPPECVEYAKTGDAGKKSVCESVCRGDNPLFDATYWDEIITNYGVGSEPRNRYSNLVFPHTQRRVNPTDPSRYMYFKHALPFYAPSNEGTAFCYAPGYDTNPIPVYGYSSYSYNCGSSPN
jgi:hypothetical protein